LPVIAVGNLSVGGTGKTPQIEYLILLSDQYKVALSRGYKDNLKVLFCLPIPMQKFWETNLFSF
jgi:tetraacyldisaccharide-1-P 4'-kinase